MSHSDNEEAIEPKWGRATPWRQGSILSKECAIHLGLVDPNGDDKLVIVASHDCDIAQSAAVEPTVEVIIGSPIEGIGGNFANGKNARQLHLPCNAGPEAVNVALLSTQKRSVPKEAYGPALSDYAPCERFQIGLAERKVFQRWLAARYLRAAFADEFDDRLGKTKVRERLEKALKPMDQHIAAVYFDVDNGDEIPRSGADDPFELEITLLYNSAIDPDESRKAAESLRDEIQAIFSARCMETTGITKQWKWIELVAIHVVSDEAMSVAQSQRLSKWHADHISLRSDPHGPIVDPA